MDRKVGINTHKPALEKKKRKPFKSSDQSFFDNTFEIIFRSSSDDKILFCNKLFDEGFGFDDIHKARDFSAFDLFVNPDDYWRIKRRLSTGEQIQRHAVNFRKLNGKKIVALLNAQSQIDEEGELVFNWVALDISERVQFEQNLEQKNLQLAKINSQMEKFLYSTSHDLRSPLTSILGLVNLTRLHTADQTIMEYVGRIESSAQRLDSIIIDIISFSKTTYQNIYSEKIDFDALIWKVINTHHSHENFGRLKIEVAIKGESTFYNDPDRLEIILENLIRNAIQFLDATKLRPFLHILVNEVPEHVTIEVHDNGIGIARQYFDQIFNMFYKASIQSKGAGLGLYIAREGVEQLAGNISVESEVGFGSVFKVFIPNSVKGKLIHRKSQLGREEVKR
ncbi:MAG TPA: HAMP domain-containing sensor histidine kinase [Chryseolinea sp.]